MMLVIVSSATLAGFFASTVLLDLNIRAIWFRYGIAVGVAYVSFLSLLWRLVLRYRSRPDVADIVGQPQIWVGRPITAARTSPISIFRP